MHPSQTFEKVWTFRNDGDCQWPSDAKFIQTNGDNLGAKDYALGKSILPGEQIDVRMFLIAPSLPGKYCSFFRFVYGDNDRFG